MAITAGELFVNIFVKSDTAQKSLTKVQSGVEEVRSSSLAAKAAVVGLFYALEQMTAAAGAKGAGLMNMSSSLGLTVERLQSMHNAFRDVNVSGEEVDATLSGIQKTVTNIARGGGITPDFARFATAVHLDPTKIQDLTYMMQKAQEFAKANQANPGMVKAMLGGALGISDNVIAGMIRNKNGDLTKMIGPIESGRMIKSLDNVNAAWGRLKQRLETMRDVGVVNFGAPMLNELGHALTQLQKLGAEIGKLAKQHPEVAKLLGVLAAIAALAAPFGAIGLAITAITTLLAEMDKHADAKSGFWYWMNKKDLDKDVGGAAGKGMNWLKGLFSPDTGFGPKPAPDGSKGQPTTVAPTINIHTDTKDPKKHAQIIADHIKVAVFQSQALTQVT